MSDPDRIPRLARPFVLTLIAAMLACAIFAWEPWPLTSFRLFSTLRVDEQSAFSATIVTADGEEVPYPLGAEDHGFRGFPFTMAEFSGAGAERRDELCRTWVEAAPTLVGRHAEEVRIYLRRWTLSEREGDRALPGVTRLAYVCTAEGVSHGG
jgi:hypothetical protein